MIAKASSIFDYTIDADSKGAKVSSASSHLADYEREMGRFPKDDAAAATMAPDNLTIETLGFQSLCYV